MKSRPTRGVWIEILSSVLCYTKGARHAPHGACGLKFSEEGVSEFIAKSRPTRGVWIEMFPFWS